MPRKNRRGGAIAGCSVTINNFTTPKRGYRLGDITRVSIRRPLLLFAAPFMLGVVMLMSLCYDLMYAGEKIFCVLFLVMAGFVGFGVGVIHLTGFNISGWAAFGRYDQMAEIKRQLDAAIEQSGRSSRRRGHRQ